MYLIQLSQFLLSIRIDKFFDNHVPSTDSNNKLSIEDLSIDLSGTEDIVTIAKFLYRDWTVSLMDVLTNHLIKEITLRDQFRRWGRNMSGEIFDSSLQLLDDTFFLLEIGLHFMNFIFSLLVQGF